MSSAKEKYQLFCKSNYVPIFYRDYYLDAVCDAPWDVVIHEEGDQIKGAYVFMLKSKWMLNYIIHPKVCPYTGLLLFDPSNADLTFKSLLNQLPNYHLLIHDYFHQTLEFGVDKSVEYKKHTYVIDNNVVLDDLWSNQSSVHRRIIRKAEKELTYSEVEDMDVFLDFVTESFSKQGKQPPNDPQVFSKLDETLNSKGQRRIVQCVDAKGDVVAMCYFIIDEEWTYNFANAVSNDYRHYGMNLIIWNQIKKSLEKGKSFDFEGSMIPGVNEFFKRYKGRKINYPSIYRSKNKFVDLLVSFKNPSVHQV